MPLYSIAWSLDTTQNAEQGVANRRGGASHDERGDAAGASTQMKSPNSRRRGQARGVLTGARV
jgi:hypothetical protein